LTAEQRKELEHGYQNSNSHTFRQRCHIILLKSEKRTSLDIANILGCCEMAVNNWLQRYQQEGLQGLHTRAGRGRAAILQAADAEQVKRAVQESRQRISWACAELAASLGKTFSVSTLKRFVKKTVDASNALEKG
jgi:transposase